MIQEILHKEIQSIVGRGVEGPSYMRLTSSYLAAALKESQRLLPAKGPCTVHTVPINIMEALFFDRPSLLSRFADFSTN
jgi:hypothetical protein